jgi:hydrogenase nickel incorporation protein HypA/HybF
MHELSVTESILEIALRHAEKAKAQRILGLNIVIGQLASIVDDSVQFYWDMIAKDTMAEGAQLRFERIAAELECENCCTRYPLDGKDLACPNCQGTKIKIVSGKEFYIASIDVE